MTEVKQINPELYAKLAEPHATVEVAKEKMAAFLEELYEIRVKHGIPEVLVVAVAYANETVDEKEHVRTVCEIFTVGDSRNAPDLAVLAYRELALPLIQRAEGLYKVATGK